MCVHTLVCEILPPLWIIDVEGTFCCLFTMCSPSLFCLRHLHRNTEYCSALFFAFSSSVYFFFPFLLSAIWMLNWCLSLPVRVTFQAQLCGSGSRGALPMCRDTLGGAAGLDAQLLWCFLTAAPASRRGRLSRSVSWSCAFISGAVVKNKAFQHIKYPFGKREQKAPSPSCVSGCSGQALGEPLPHSSRFWVPLTKAWVLWEKVSRGFSAICAGHTATSQTVSLLPLSGRIVATCPGFAQWSWLLRTWICSWAWRCSVLFLGSPKVALTAEQQRRFWGLALSFLMEA